MAIDKRNSGIPRGWRRALVSLLKQDGASISELAKLDRVTASAMSHTVKYLEEDGSVTRHRRGSHVFVFLTPIGRSIARTYQKGGGVLPHELASLESGDLHVLEAAVAILRRVLELRTARDA